MEIQLISDIHLEMRSQPFEIRPQAPILALLGDIGNPYDQNYQEFIALNSERFDEVWLLAGNHEFYHNEFYATHSTLQELSNSYSNVIYFNRASHTYGNYRVLGCVLWSHIIAQHATEIHRRLNDFRYIRFNDQQLKLEDYKNCHQKDLKWLVDELEICREQKKECLVLTHHAPLIRSGHPQYHGSSLTSAFANPFEELLCYPVKAWLFGHTHWPIDVSFGNQKHHTRVMSSPLGYEGEQIPSSPNGVVLKI